MVGMKKPLGVWRFGCWVLWCDRTEQVVVAQLYVLVRSNLVSCAVSRVQTGMGGGWRRFKKVQLVETKMPTAVCVLVMFSWSQLPPNLGWLVWCCKLKVKLKAVDNITEDDIFAFAKAYQVLVHFLSLVICHRRCPASLLADLSLKFD